MGGGSVGMVDSIRESGCFEKEKKTKNERRDNRESWWSEKTQVVRLDIFIVLCALCIRDREGVE